jgi:hypothetical protein
VIGTIPTLRPSLAALCIAIRVQSEGAAAAGCVERAVPVAFHRPNARRTITGAASRGGTSKLSHVQTKIERD